MRITELQEGVEYYMTHLGVTQLAKYRIFNNKLEVKCTYMDWMKSNYIYNFLSDCTFEPCEWEPKTKDIYYYPNFTKQLAGTSCWDGFENELAIKRNVGVYRTREEAIAKAKELGWT